MSQLLGNGLKRLTLLLIVSVSVSLSLDSMFSYYVRPNLGLLAALLLAHVMPTFFLAFRDFDQQTELWERTVYANSGPLGFGFFLGAVLHSLMQDPHLPEGVTASAILMTLVAVLVAFSYWNSGTMSRASLSAQMEKSRYPRPVVDLLAGLKAHRYHVLAAAGQEAVMNGRVAQLLERDGWFSQVQQLLLNEGYSPVKIEHAEAVFRRMVDDLEAVGTD